MNKDLYVTYIGAKGVAIGWIGAVFGPIFVLIGLDSNYRLHLYLGIGMLVIVLLLLADGIKAIRNGVKSDFIAFTVVPGFLLILGFLLAFLSNEGYI